MKREKVELLAELLEGVLTEMELRACPTVCDKRWTRDWNTISLVRKLMRDKLEGRR